jgi:antitoxin VapB
MDPSSKHTKADKCAHGRAALTGEDLAHAPKLSLQQRRGQERWKRCDPEVLAARLDELARDCSALPDHDLRSPDEIVGYDESGMW